MNKIQIDFSDAIPLTGKISISEKDSEGEELFIGDTVTDNRNEKYVIGYRYGSISLIPLLGMHTLSITDYSDYKKVHEMTYVLDKYLIIGYDSEDFFTVNFDVSYLGFGGEK